MCVVVVVVLFTSFSSPPEPSLSPLMGGTSALPPAQRSSTACPEFQSSDTRVPLTFSACLVPGLLVHSESEWPTTLGHGAGTGVSSENPLPQPELKVETDDRQRPQALGSSGSSHLGGLGA